MYFVLTVCRVRPGSGTDTKLLIDLLEYSRRWSILCLREYAIDHLEPLIAKHHVQSCVVISIARTHGISRWIEPSIRDLRNTSLESWMFQDDIISWVPPDVMSAICVLREKLHHKRVELAVHGLNASHGPNCHNIQSCSMSWDLLWWATVSKPLLSTDDIWRPTIREIRKAAESMRVPGMMDSCFEITMGVLRETSVWDFEEEYIQETIECLMVPDANVQVLFDNVLS